MSAHWMKGVLALAVIGALAAANASGAMPAQPRASPSQIAEAKRVLETNGYSNVSVLSSDDQIITVSALKDGARATVDVDPMTGIILPHVDLPPLPAQLRPFTGLPSDPR